MPSLPAAAHALRSGERPSLLIVGAYLADEPNCIGQVVTSITECLTYQVVQRWVGLGGPPPTPQVALVTSRTLAERRPKFELINALLAEEEVERYEYVVVVDDDVDVPAGFLERFLTLQTSLGFALAQPARTSHSYYDHPIVEQQQGLVARQTRFVEIGPVFSIHRSAYPALLPFDLTSPMGWGYSNVWAHRLSAQGLTMGIIDALPVTHSLRKSVTQYRWEDADRARARLLAAQPHKSIEQCFQVLDVVTDEAGVLRHHQVAPEGSPPQPELTVIVATRNHMESLRMALESLADQGLQATQYEVLVVDAASDDATPDVCRQLQHRLPLRYLRIATPLLSSAKNVGVLAARGAIVLWFPDDEQAHPELLKLHLRMHRRHRDEVLAVAGASARHVSCHRSLLVRHGLLRQELETGPAEAELGSRLAKFGMRVVAEPQGVAEATHG